MLSPVCALMALLLAGCVGSQIVPKDMEPQIMRDVPFDAIKTDPDRYKGRLCVLGGKVLGAKRLKSATQIEVLQLPLDRWDVPRTHELSDSAGRFLAYHAEFLDPAALPAGTIVSMIVEVQGVKKMPLDEEEYTYPTFNIRTLKVWRESTYTRPGSQPYFYRNPYYPFYPYYWWDPWY